MKLTGDRCKCPTCGLYFNSTHAFDKHRVGRYDLPGDRRCLSITEMSSKGMQANSQGFWISKAYKDIRKSEAA